MEVYCSKCYFFHRTKIKDICRHKQNAKVTIKKNYYEKIREIHNIEPPHIKNKNNDCELFIDFKETCRQNFEAITKHRRGLKR